MVTLGCLILILSLKTWSGYTHTHARANWLHIASLRIDCSYLIPNSLGLYEWNSMYRTELPFPLVLSWVIEQCKILSFFFFFFNEQCAPGLWESALFLVSFRRYCLQFPILLIQQIFMECLCVSGSVLGCEEIRVNKTDCTLETNIHELGVLC